MEVIKNTAINDHAPDAGEKGCPPAEAQGDFKKQCKIKAFMAGEALGAFNADFLSEHLCRPWVLNKLHGAEPPRCPGCGEAVADHLLRSFWENRRVRCGKCRKMFTALTGTFLSGCHMAFREVYLLAVLLSVDLADRHIAQMMKMSPENVRLWRLKFNDVVGHGR